MPEHDDRMLVSEAGVRNAFLASGVGMVALVVLFLVLATAQPQGTYQTADDSQYRATLTGATQDLEGFELVGDGGARIDIDHAMDLVLDRGVDLTMTSLAPPPAPAPMAQTAPADGTAADGTAADGTASDEASDEADAAPSETELLLDRLAAATDADGEATYANCVACHQAAGTGIAGAFPPLANGHAADLALADGGRDYLVHTLLYGVQGRMTVEGMSYNGVMPAWPQLSDDQIASVLNYIVSDWDNVRVLPAEFEPFSADEVAASRGEGLASSEVLELRPVLP